MRVSYVRSSEFACGTDYSCLYAIPAYGGENEAREMVTPAVRRSREISRYISLCIMQLKPVTLYSHDLNAFRE
ncbi:hypothetical protein PUN28_003264 [Cardiocondyla obscurior]|uniref:Uncharacterized protein n=1 Tax=Cardiocondyla obscurior TaxID=286306 RepID=A0AAW2GL43_9HYME